MTVLEGDGAEQDMPLRDLIHAIAMELVDNPDEVDVTEVGSDNNSVIEATPSAPGPKLNSFDDCTWANSCAAP